MDEFGKPYVRVSSRPDHNQLTAIDSQSQIIRQALLSPSPQVFLLYTRLASLKPADGNDGRPFRGLGCVDSKTDNLSVKLEINPPAAAAPSTVKLTGRSRSAKSKGKVRKDESKILEFELAQDGSALRHRSGDTGSVLWRARAGTGLLSMVLGPLVRRYTATDLPELIPLIRKNISRAVPPSSSSHAYMIAAESLDWTLPAHRQLPHETLSDPPDLLLVVDCIYHPSLIPPLIDTLTTLAVPQRTAVLVLAELRAEDVIREFLERWVGGKGWEVWSVGGGHEDGMMGARFGMWVGWREV
ncbi:hypothetical protein EW146_g7904 [Bondarzewia mesenterica]|uniref:Uncharacterized protein n=1 Tax=Bondarzewia mesenterica TaxID=1095465 RepID=A0A4S4LJ88_9AGAM|nr:hypothetical protein EW146_g7904 [Bondarzewia mesenterica]